MAVSIPVGPGTQMTWRLKSHAWELEPSMGGTTQRIAKLGDRFILDYTARTLSATYGAEVIGALIQGLTNRVRVPVIQKGLDIGSPSNGTVTSGSGTSLTVSGMGGYTFKAGQFFSIEKDGKSYLHICTAAGSGSLSIYPMLRVNPAGATLNAANPVIEGFVQGDEQAWSQSLTGAVSLSFTVIEAN